MDSITNRPEPVNGSRRRHAAIRHIDPFRHLVLAEQAVSELRADWLADKPSEGARADWEWLPMVRHDAPEPEPGTDGFDDDVAREKVVYADDDNPILDLPPDRDDDDAEDESWRYGPLDDGGGGWDAYDDSRWTITEPGPLVLTMAERVFMEAERYRGWGTFLGDILAERMTALAEQFRLLDSNDPLTFRDRRQAMLTHAVDDARRRFATAGVCEGGPR